MGSDNSAAGDTDPHKQSDAELWTFGRIMWDTIPDEKKEELRESRPEGTEEDYDK